MNHLTYHLDHIPQKTLAPALVLLVVSIFTAKLLHRKISNGTLQQHRLRRLPSPPGYPLIGHVHHLLNGAASTVFAKWYKEYGEIVLIKALHHHVIVLNTVSAARSILEKKGSRFSGRPPFVYFNEWLGWRDSVPFMPCNASHGRQRRLVHQYMSPQAVVDHYPTIRKHCYDLLEALKGDSSNFRSHIQDFTSHTLVKIVYGYDVFSKDDPLFSMVETVSDLTVNVAMTTAMVLDLFPFVQYLPSWFIGMGAKKAALRGNILRQEVSSLLFERLRHSGEPRDQSPPLMSLVLADMEKESCGQKTLKDPETRNVILNLGAVLYCAGVDAVASPLATFILAMLLYPEVALRAQREVDNVTGGPRNDAIPTLADRKNMPYVECVLREVLRWNPPAPLGVTHFSERGDEYNGMEIPPRSSVIANIWFMSHDEDKFAEPNVFNPDRFLDLVSHQGAHTLKSDHDPKSFVFGFGRRVCPGEHIADTLLWAAMTAILATFDILPAVDPTTGCAVVTEPRFSTGTASAPEPFECQFVLRDV